MTDQQRATICLRCGGLRDRCECAEIRREAFTEAEKFCTAHADYHLQFAAMDRFSAGQAAGADFCANECRHLARKPGPL
jgi:hypothetical protein